MSGKPIKFGTALSLIFLLSIFGRTNPQDWDSSLQKEHRDIVMDWEQAVSSQDFQKMRELMSIDYVWHFPGRDIVGWENVKLTFQGLFKAFPDLKLSSEDVVSDGEKVVVRWNISGTHQGEYLGIKPSGKSIFYTSISIDRVVNGKFVEGWEVYDELGMKKQLGGVMEFPAISTISDTIEKNKATEIQAIKQIHQKAAAAVRDGDVAAYVDLFTENGIYLWPDVPAIVGREALLAWFKKRFSQYSAELEKTIEEIEIMGNWAFERGKEVSKIKNRLTGEVYTVRGKFINIFQKQQDGSWKIARRIRNMDSPSPPIEEKR